ncbi:hypothetical protein Tco_0118511, partial [Tanacetum coccineum]
RDDDDTAVGWGGQPLMEVVVAATVAATATMVVHDGCDGGDFGEVERRQCGGVRMMMMATVVRRW